MYDPRTYRWKLPSRTLLTAGGLGLMLLAAGCGSQPAPSASAAVTPQSAGGADLGDGQVYTLTSQISGLCLDDRDWSKTAGAAVQQWTCSGLPVQQWKLLKKVVSNQTYYALANVNSGLCLDVDHAGLQDGALALQWTCQDSPNQRFAVQRQPEGNYTLIAQHSDKCLDVPGGNKATGVQIWQWTCLAGNQYQRWQLKAVGTTPPPPPPPTSSKVELRVYNTDDVSYVSVDGVRRGVFKAAAGDTGKLDVSKWFAGGAGALRLETINKGGGRNYGFTLWVDGQQVVNETCNNACPDKLGLIFDKTVTVNARGPAKQRVTVGGPAGGDLYINNTYTGKTAPATLDLVPGRYTFAIGTDGGYYQQDLDVVAGQGNVQITAGRVPIKTWKVAILPIRRTFHGDQSEANTGVVTQQDIDIFTGQMRATNEQQVKPYSYGLVQWQITVLPTVENVALNRGASPDNWPDVGRFYSESGLTNLENQYDTVAVLYSNYQQNGAPVTNQPCCGWGGGKTISIMNGFGVRGGSATAPMEGYLHEWLHSVESYNEWLRYGGYNGVNGLHGAVAHGYHSPTGWNWLPWYKLFMRGQVKETFVMGGQDLPNMPATADLYTGVFDTLLLGPSAPVQNVVTYPPSGAATAAGIRSQSLPAAPTQRPPLP